MTRGKLQALLTRAENTMHRAAFLRRTLAVADLAGVDNEEFDRLSDEFSAAFMESRAASGELWAAVNCLPDGEL